MYNFRYHLVTIVSIFVSLALGLLLGAAIAASDLAQSTTDDMIDSILSRYDTLTQENTRLEQEAQDNLALASTLSDPWMDSRLEGRTIAMLLGNSQEDEMLQASITQTIKRAGGTVVGITVERSDFGLEDDEVRAALQEIVSEEPGVDYQQTLAQSLSKEWSFVYVGLSAGTGDTASSLIATEADFSLATHRYVVEEAEEGSGVSAEGAPASGSSGVEQSGSGQQPEQPQSGGVSTVIVQAYTQGELSPRSPLQKVLHERYALTTTLLSLGVISISVDYASLTQDVGSSVPTDQRAAYSIATAWQLPYGINGFINGFAPAQGNETSHSSVGLYLTQQIQTAGDAGELSYPSWFRTKIPSRAVVGTAEQPSYFALLLQPAHLSSAMEQAASENGLSCLTSPTGVSGEYSLIALLSGSQVGIYGDNQVSEKHLAPLPEDFSGRAIFR